jgi:prolyl 4-hydroxylase
MALPIKAIVLLMFVIIISGILTTLLFFPKSGTVVANSSNSNATRKLYEDGSYVYTAFDSASWAITSNILSPILGTDKQSLYDDYIVQCNEAISKKNEDEGTTTDSNVCNINDEYRQKMNAYQPKSVFNYTKGGYTKTRVPSDLFDLIKEFFNKNRHLAEIEWKQYNVYHNAWSVPPTIVRLQKEKILINQIQEQVKPILEEWTGMHLSPVSTYGIRMYHNGSILAPHVDRMPLVASVISKYDRLYYVS